ncbi:MAG: hypothetical protein AB1601_01845 [Planctomycetota bacterium]
MTRSANPPPFQVAGGDSLRRGGVGGGSEPLATNPLPLPQLNEGQTDDSTTQQVAEGPRAAQAGPAILLAVALLAAGLIAYEVVLMRRLVVERWHHFGFLVISVALLGFGASGTLLAIFERRVRKQAAGTLRWLAVALTLALLALPRAATLLPVTARFIPADLWSQVGWWSLYWLVAFVPFLLGGTFLGAALMTAGPRVGRVYAANLLGSGAGAVGAVLLLSRVSLEHTFWPSVALAALAAALVPGPTLARRMGLVSAVAALSVALGIMWPLRPAYDEHKYAAHVQRLVEQGSARRVAARADPHGYVELYESDRFHDLPFLALTRRPPPMYSLLVNGDPAGSVLRIDAPAEAAVLDDTLMALPYRLLLARQDRALSDESWQPRVLLLGESGGANAWLARRQEAAYIDLVQPNAAILALLREFAPALVTAPEVRFHATDPRRFLARTPAATYDLIQVVSLEGLGVGSAGLRGLAEDHLATVEGFAAAIRALSDAGVLAISRGIQSPPRDNIRLLATLTEALESLGVTQPERHIVQMRDYLGVCTLALKTPLDDARRTTLRAAQHELNLTPVWYDGLPPEEVNRPDALDGPPGQPWDWMHHAAREIFSPRRAAFYEAWLLNIRPARDDRPFFWDFYKPAAVRALRETYGDLWLTRVEIGRLFLYTALLIGAAAAVAFILLPLAVGETWRRGRVGTGERGNGGTWERGDEAGAAPRTPLPSRSPAATRCGEEGLGEGRITRAPRCSHGVLAFTLLYFSAIGLGFMALEMALISRAIHGLGDPVIASAAVIGGVLLLSGVGSLAARRIVGRHTWPAPLAIAALALVLRVTTWSEGGADLTGPWVLLTTAVLAAILMGMPMPTGLTRLDQQAPYLVPWAWGLNGVASVVATSGAIAVAMTRGYGEVMLLAAGAYTLAGGAGALAASAAAFRTARQT